MAKTKIDNEKLSNVSGGESGYYASKPEYLWWRLDVGQEVEVYYILFSTRKVHITELVAEPCSEGYKPAYKGYIIETGKEIKFDESKVQNINSYQCY